MSKCEVIAIANQKGGVGKTAMPFGIRKIDALRTLTTESLAVFIPFRVQEINH